MTPLEKNLNVTVDIGIPTYKRPAQLNHLLESLSNLIIPKGVTVTIIVVDNDAGRSGQDVVQRYQTEGPFPVTYLLEEKVGVVHVRNRLLDVSTAEYLAMVDDDQYAVSSWLAEMVSTMELHGADAVVGDVEPVFPDHSPSWLIRNHGYEPIGEMQLRNGSTNNVLLRRSSLVKRGMRFDPQFNFTGGEDTDFFYRLVQSGGKIYGSLRGKIFAPIDPTRVNLAWYVLRNFRVGQTNSVVYGRNVALYVSSLRKVGRGFIGGVLLVAGCLLFLVRRADGCRIAFTGIRNLGYASTFGGLRAREYGKQ